MQEQHSRLTAEDNPSFDFRYKRGKTTIESTGCCKEAARIAYLDTVMRWATRIITAVIATIIYKHLRGGG